MAETRKGTVQYKYCNPHPTETEKEMYHYAGYYLIEKKDGCYLRYAPVYSDNKKEFPTELSPLPENVVEKESIQFDIMAETVAIKGCVDLKILNLISQRAKELGFK